MAFASPRQRTSAGTSSQRSAGRGDEGVGGDDGYETILRRPVDTHCSTCNVLRGAFEVGEVGLH